MSFSQRLHFSRVLFPELSQFSFMIFFQSSKLLLQIPSLLFQPSLILLLHLVALLLKLLSFNLKLGHQVFQLLFKILNLPLQLFLDKLSVTREIFLELVNNFFKLESLNFQFTVFVFFQSVLSIFNLLEIRPLLLFYFNFQSFKFLGQFSLICFHILSSVSQIFFELSNSFLQFSNLTLKLKNLRF